MRPTADTLRSALPARSSDGSGAARRGSAKTEELTPARVVALLERIAEDIEAIRHSRQDPDESLTKAEAARFLRVSPRTLTRYMKAGLKHYAGPTFSRRDMVAFREQLAVEPATPKLRKVV